MHGQDRGDKPQRDITNPQGRGDFAAYAHQRYEQDSKRRQIGTTLHEQSSDHSSSLHELSTSADEAMLDKSELEIEKLLRHEEEAFTTRDWSQLAYGTKYTISEKMDTLDLQLEEAIYLYQQKIEDLTSSTDTIQIEANNSEKAKYDKAIKRWTTFLEGHNIIRTEMGIPSRQQGKSDKSKGKEIAPDYRWEPNPPKKIGNYSLDNTIPGTGMNCFIHSILRAYNQYDLKLLPDMSQNVRHYLVQQGMARENQMLEQPQGIQVIKLLREQGFIDGRAVRVYYYTNQQHNSLTEPYLTDYDYYSATPGNGHLDPIRIFLHNQTQHYSAILAEEQTLVEGDPQTEPQRVQPPENRTQERPIASTDSPTQRLPWEPDKLSTLVEAVHTLKKKDPQARLTGPLSQRLKAHRLNAEEWLAIQNYCKQNGIETRSATYRYFYEYSRATSKTRGENTAKNKGMTVSEYRKRVMENTAKNKGISVSEYRKQLKENTAKNKGMQLSEYKKQLEENTAKNKGISVSEYRKQLKENTAKNKGISVSEYRKHRIENAAKNKGISVSEYRKQLKENTAKNKGISVSEYRKQLEENTAKNKGISVSEYRKQLEENAAKNKGISVSEYRKHRIENAAKNKGISVSEYRKHRIENAAKNKGMTVSEYRKYTEENAAKNKGMTVSEYRKHLEENAAKNKGISVSEYRKHLEENAAKNKGMTVSETEGAETFDTTLFNDAYFSDMSFSDMDSLPDNE